MWSNANIYLFIFWVQYTNQLQIWMAFPSRLIFAERPHRPPPFWPRVHPPACVLLPEQRPLQRDQQYQRSSGGIPRIFLRASGRAFLLVNTSVTYQQSLTQRRRVLDWLLFWRRGPHGVSCLEGTYWGSNLERAFYDDSCTEMDSCYNNTGPTIFFLPLAPKTN